MTHKQLKDMIANNDMDVAVIEKQYATIDSYLRDMGHIIPMVRIEKAVNDLATNDAYFVHMATNLGLGV